VALAALAALPHGAAGQSTPTNTYALLSPSQPVTAPPPLGAGADAPQTQTAVEFLLPGKVSIRELVEVGVDGDGEPVQVAATQRLDLKGTGDYAFTIPAPATNAGPTEESQSAPGLRDVGIVWQGFSNKERILAARAELRTAEAAKALPLRLRIEEQGGGSVLRLENATERKLPVVKSRTTRSALLEVLERLRRSSRRTQIVGGSVYVQGTAGRGSSIETAAPLHVTGTITQGAAAQQVDTILGGRQPLDRSITLRGTGEPKLRLRVELLPPREVLPTPGELQTTADPLKSLQQAIGAVAISHAYRRYLAAPNPSAESDAAYVYTTAARATAVTAATPDEGSDTLTIVLVALLGAASLGGLAVLWARS
jgi:hypothetical protein